MAWTSPPLRRAAAAAALALGVARLVLCGATASAAGPTAPITHAPPDVSGPGAVLRAGRVHMKVTNYGHVGNIFQNLSADPAGQWPGDSGVEYLRAISLAVGAKDVTTADPNRRRRASYLFNWRPPSLAAEDRIYAASDTALGGARFVNDDGDRDVPHDAPLVDEDFLDGRDNDGDGRIDEDFAGIGDQMFSLVMRDDTPQAMAADSTYLPLGLECRQVAWAYSRPGFDDFCAVEYTIFNRSGHTLDSVYVGWSADMDIGPLSDDFYFTDDRDVPGFPSGEFVQALDAHDPRRQLPHADVPGVSPDSALCPRLAIRVNGFAMRDGRGDAARAPGIAMFLLADHTTDPRGISAPARVGFRAFRSFPSGLPYFAGGNPTTPAQRYEFMSGTEHVDPFTGFVDTTSNVRPGDYRQWCSIGPFRNLADGASVHATILFAVQNQIDDPANYLPDYERYRAGTLSAAELFSRYPALRTAYDAQLAFEGRYELRPDFPAPDFHGRESALQLPPGSSPIDVADCRDAALGRSRVVDDRAPAWFDFDCDACTGVWDATLMRGLFHHTWTLGTPLVASAGAASRVSADVRLASANPAREDVRFEVAAPSGARVHLAIFDPAGRRVRTVEDVGVAAGPRRLRWDLRDAAGARVRPGLYFFRARIGDAQRSGTIVVLR